MIATLPENSFVADWSPDGAFLLLNQSDGETGFDLWLLSLHNPNDRRPLVNSAADEYGGRFSPDGHWVMYASNESGQVETYLRPFPDLAAGKWQVPGRGTAHSQWGRNGQRVLVVPQTNPTTPEAYSVLAIDMAQVIKRAVSAPERLFPFRALGGQGRLRYLDVDPRSERLLLNVYDLPPLSPVSVILNWNEVNTH